MLLSCRILEDVKDVNSFEYASAAMLNEGNEASIFIQLIDESLDKSLNGFKPAGRRFVPAAGATLQVTLDSLDNAKKVVKNAVQPYAQDPSIWRIDITALDSAKLKGTVNIKLVLTESAKVTNGKLKAGVLVEE